LNHLNRFCRERGIEMSALQKDGWGDQRYWVFFRGYPEDVREAEHYARQISGW
jgi:hypothetical protein